MKKAILFDVDGTLLDTYNFVFDAVKYTTAFYNHSYPSDINIKTALGKPLLEFYQTLIPEGNMIELSETHKQFQQENFHLVKPFKATKEVLKTLKDKGFLLAGVSNRLGYSLVYSLKVTKVARFFDVVVSADDVKNPKPHKEHVLTALGKLGVEPINAYMVGDTGDDILAGKNAGVKTVGVTYGFLGKDIAQYNPDFIIDDIEELFKILI